MRTAGFLMRFMYVFYFRVPSVVCSLADSSTGEVTGASNLFLSAAVHVPTVIQLCATKRIGSHILTRWLLSRSR